MPLGPPLGGFLAPPFPTTGSLLASLAHADAAFAGRGGRIPRFALVALLPPGLPVALEPVPLAPTVPLVPPRALTGGAPLGTLLVIPFVYVGPVYGCEGGAP